MTVYKNVANFIQNLLKCMWKKRRKYIDGSFEEDIQPNAEEIIRNEKVKNDKKAQYEQ